MEPSLTVQAALALMHRPSAAQLALLALTLVVGAALRMFAYDWGRPLLLHPDEYAVAHSAFRMHERETFDPDFFARPNHVSIYASALAYPLASHLTFGEPVARIYPRERPFFRYVSRLLCACFGVLGIAAAYLVGRRFHAHVGLYAAALFALFPAYVEHAHYATPDVPLTTLSTLVLACVLAYLQEGKTRSLVAACALAALSFIEKYPGLLTCAAVGLAVWLVPGRRWTRALLESLKAAALFLLFVFCASPFLVLRIADVQAAIARERTTTHAGADGLGWFGNAAFYGHGFVERGGYVLLGLSLLGLAYGLRKQARLTAPLLLGALYWVSLSALGLHWERWALPMYLTPLLLAAIGVHGAVSWAARKNARAGAGMALALALLLVYRLGLAASLVDADLDAEDTRVAALSYATARGIKAQNSLYDGYSPFLPLQFRREKVDLARPPRRRDYVVLSSFVYDRYYLDPKQHRKVVEWYEAARKLPLLARFEAGCAAVPDGDFLSCTLAGRVVQRLRHPGSCMAGPSIEIRRLRK